MRTSAEGARLSKTLRRTRQEGPRLNASNATSTTIFAAAIFGRLGLAG